MPKFLEKWKQNTRHLKIEVFALYLAYRDPRTPRFARVFAACVVGYAFCPIDLIPDFIPVLGYLDDLILVPLGIKIALGLIPPEIMSECREKAGRLTGQDKPVHFIAAGIIVLIWLSSLLFMVYLLNCTKR